MRRGNFPGVHTQKIYDSCQSKDCLEDLRVYLTAASQSVLDCASSVKAARAELLYVSVQVDSVGFHRGFYTVDLRYYYRITAEAATGGCRTTPITGLAVFDKRCMLFGSQGMAKTFTSDQRCPVEALGFGDNLPVAVVEAVDPVVLSVRIKEQCCNPNCGCGCDCNCNCSCTPCECPTGIDIPEAILGIFDCKLDFSDQVQKELLVTLGQFSILRMERDTQLLIPVYDYCMPKKECLCDGPTDDDPCRLFQQIEFPVNDFFPPAAAKELNPLEHLNCRPCCRS